MARRENDADLIGGINLASHDKQLARVLLDLSTTAQISDSLRLGSSVLRELERVNRLHKLRDESRYDSLDPLTPAIAQDVHDARAYLGAHPARQR